MRGGWLRGLVSASGGREVALVQYADDTLFLLEASISSARAARFISFCFELVSGLSHNWSKCALLPIHTSSDHAAALAQAVGCLVHSFPSSALGLPLICGSMTKALWDPLIQRFHKRLAGWRGRHLSYGGRLTLLHTILSALPLFFLSVFRIPTGVLERLEIIRRRFF
ncbi:hypothetical protein QJS10_CPB12g00900 [Acorus calamus]|uniref:Reverse transcriptase domain-containing protein n=1 Tax=Acorus calamus TaxID=4465 RepID=A0AAV9DN44_ACOCL|nr:hypothetical protein QJS10_CPB12g00900 [Acorus calamus]